VSRTPEPDHVLPQVRATDLPVPADDGPANGFAHREQLLSWTDLSRSL